MAIKPSQRKAVAKYNASNYDRVELRLPKGRKAEVEQHAQSVGETINGYVNGLIREDMGIPDNEWGKESDMKTSAQLRRVLGEHGYSLKKKHRGADSWCIVESGTEVHVAGFDGGWDAPGLTLEEVQEMVKGEFWHI